MLITETSPLTEIAVSRAYETSASALGWPPCTPWPKQVPTTLGSGEPLDLWVAAADYAIYKQAAPERVILLVTND